MIKMELFSNYKRIKIYSTIHIQTILKEITFSDIYHWIDKILELYTCQYYCHLLSLFYSHLYYSWKSKEFINKVMNLISKYKILSPLLTILTNLQFHMMNN